MNEFIKDIDYLRIYFVFLFVILIIRGADLGYKGLIVASEKDLLFLIIAPMLWPLHCLVFIGAFIRGKFSKENLSELIEEHEKYERNKLGEYSGEPFYLTKEMHSAGFIRNSKTYQNRVWKHSTKLRVGDLIRLNEFDIFYGTDLFANAKKPDVDHACRGGE